MDAVNKNEIRKDRRWLFNNVYLSAIIILYRRVWVYWGVDFFSKNQSMSFYDHLLLRPLMFCGVFGRRTAEPRSSVFIIIILHSGFYTKCHDGRTRKLHCSRTACAAFGKSKTILLLLIAQLMLQTGLSICPI